MESSPRKAMVMAGENAANDVNEDVYSNDGTESGRRAIAGIKQVSLTFLVKRLHSNLKSVPRHRPSSGEPRASGEVGVTASNTPDFGQSAFGQFVFGHRVLPANFGQSVFGQSVFGQSILMLLRVECCCVCCCVCCVCVLLCVRCCVFFVLCVVCCVLCVVLVVCSVLCFVRSLHFPPNPPPPDSPLRTALRRTAQNSALFFRLPHHFCSFLSLWVSAR